MMDYNGSSHKFGSEPTDIKNIYVYAEDNNEISALYTVYNDNWVEKMEKSSDPNPDEFPYTVKSYLLEAGASNVNRNDKWFIARKNNNLNVNFDELEGMYQLQQQQIAEENHRQYRRFKARVVREVLKSDDVEIKPIVINSISTGVFALTSLLAMANSNGTLQRIATDAAILGVIMTGISMNNFRKKLVAVMKKEMLIDQTNNEEEVNQGSIKK